MTLRIDIPELRGVAELCPPGGFCPTSRNPAQRESFSILADDHLCPFIHFSHFATIDGIIFTKQSCRMTWHCSHRWIGTSMATKIPLSRINPSKCPLVLVEWVDSSYSLGWQHDNELPSIKKCCSVGWLRSKTKDAVVLSANITMETNPHRCCEITIPTCSITKVHKL